MPVRPLRPAAALLAALAAAGPALAADPSATPASEEQIRRWIDDLGSDRYEVREAATRKLDEAGDAARGLLAKIESDDPEVQLRVKSILEKDFTENHAQAVEALRRLAMAEAFWRAKDPDGNGANDFWTRDVAGLHAVPGDDRTFPRLVDAELARADAAPAKAYAKLEGAPAPRQGYLFRALKTDPKGQPYVQDAAAPPTGANAPAGACANDARFAFSAWPARHGRDGTLTFLVGENGMVWQKDLGREAAGVTAWPDPEKPDSGWAAAEFAAGIEGGVWGGRFGGARAVVNRGGMVILPGGQRVFPGQVNPQAIPVPVPAPRAAPDNP